MNTEIRTQRLVLRPIGPEYLETTHAYASDPDNCRLMMFLPYETREETLAWLEDCARQWASPGQTVFAFVVLLDGEHIGHVGIELYGDGTGELEWALHPAHHGRGYAVEAARALADFGRGTLGVRRFIAHCDAENRASRRVMDRLGMMLTDDTGTRKNRGSDESRREYLYEMT